MQLVNNTAAACIPNIILCGISYANPIFPPITMNGALISTAISGFAATLSESFAATLSGRVSAKINQDQEPWIQNSIIALFVISSNLITTVGFFKKKCIPSALIQGVSSGFSIFSAKFFQNKHREQTEETSHPIQPLEINSTHQPSSQRTQLSHPIQPLEINSTHQPSPQRTQLLKSLSQITKSKPFRTCVKTLHNFVRASCYVDPTELSAYLYLSIQDYLRIQRIQTNLKPKLEEDIENVLKLWEQEPQNPPILLSLLKQCWPKEDAKKQLITAKTIATDKWEKLEMAILDQCIPSTPTEGLMALFKLSTACHNYVAIWYFSGYLQHLGFNIIDKTQQLILQQHQIDVIGESDFESYLHGDNENTTSQKSYFIISTIIQMIFFSHIINLIMKVSRSQRERTLAFKLNDILPKIEKFYNFQQTSLYTFNHALSVPVEAVQESSTGNYVYIFKENQSIELRNVKVGQIQENNTIMLLEGLKVGETVLTKPPPKDVWTRSHEFVNKKFQDIYSFLTTMGSHN